MKQLRSPFLVLTTLLISLAGCASHGPPFNAYPTGPILAAKDNQTGHEHKFLRLDEKMFEPIPMTNQIEPGWLLCPTNFFRLGPGDSIDIEMLDESPSHQTAKVGPDGKIYYQFLPGMQVWGLTLQETKEQLESKLAKMVRVKPTVAISLRQVESTAVWILGDVNRPGLYTLAMPLTILQAVSLAGGSAGNGTSRETTNWRESFILRQGRLIKPDFYALFRRGDLSQNIYLQANDFLYFRPFAPQNVYVMGMVERTGAFPYEARFTLVRAVLAAGGTRPLAYGSHVAILRGSLDRPRVAIVNYKDIVKGKKSDILLEPEDIVYVPSAPWSFAVKLGDQIIRQFVNTWALNEGRYAVDKNASAVSVSVGY